MTGELLNILQPGRVVLIAFKKSFVSFRKRHECDIIDELKKYYDVNSLFLFWKSFISKQQANIYYHISISLI